MPEYKDKKWKLWNEEQQRFAARETGGFEADLKAFETHILKLQQYAPKDTAGWPETNALSVITRLQKEYEFIKAWLGQSLRAS